MGVLDWIAGRAFSCHDPSMATLAVSASYGNFKLTHYPPQVCYTFILIPSPCAFAVALRASKKE